MDSLTFDGLSRVIKSAVDDCSTENNTANRLVGSVARVMVKTVTKEQSAWLVKNLPTVFGTRRGKLTVKRISTSKPELATPASRMAQSYQIGRYGTEVQAEAAAAQLRTNRAIQYQSAIFPNPDNYSVTVDVVSAEPATTADGSPLYPWTVDLQVNVKGTALNVSRWLRSFDAKSKVAI